MIGSRLNVKSDYIIKRNSTIGANSWILKSVNCGLNNLEISFISLKKESKSKETKKYRSSFLQTSGHFPMYLQSIPRHLLLLPLKCLDRPNCLKIVIVRTVHTVLNYELGVWGMHWISGNNFKLIMEKIPIKRVKE